MKTPTVVIGLLSITCSMLFAQQQLQQQINLPDPATVAAQRNRIMRAVVRADWEAVLTGTNPKIRLQPGTDPAELRQSLSDVCAAQTYGAAYKEAACSLLVAAPAGTVAAEQAVTMNIPQASPMDMSGTPYNPPGFCAQVGRLRMAFTWQRDQNAMQAALAGGACAMGCPACCVYAAAVSLKVLYWEFYAHDMEQLAFLNGC